MQTLTILRELDWGGAAESDGSKYEILATRRLDTAEPTEMVSTMDQISPQTAIRAIFWLSQAIIFSIVMFPTGRFLFYGWNIRKEEFTNRIDGKSIDTYLKRFWASTIARRRWGGLSEKEQFSKIYDIISGWMIYLFPIVLLGACLILFGGLAVQCAIRMGYEWYIQDYIASKTAEKDVFVQAITHFKLEELTTAFAPFPPLLLNLSALSAVAGAYLSVVQTVIYGNNTRTLLSSDLLWASFRLVIAIPLGYAVSEVAAAPLGGLVSFGLGAFPIGAIIKLLRRLTARSLNDAEDDNRDDLLKMTGVTPDVSARLNDEGVFSPQQLADTDPVSLAIRAGLSFDFVLNLAAQSQVWSYLGDTSAAMAPFGFGDARAIRKVFAVTSDEDGSLLPPPQSPPPVLAALATATKMDAAALQQILQMIAEDPFTIFLKKLG